jgi:hypothetical protein
VSWLVLAAGLSAGQEPPAPPRFPAAVEQVVVDAVVLDERGAAVTALSRDDFLLAEDGAPQEIVSFEAVEAPPARADIVFARLAPPVQWATFRDVYEVNGAPVRDRDGRLERAFRESPDTAVARAEAILVESARYNIGPVRTINLPTLPLLFLHPLNQARFTFERRGRGSGGTGVEVAFREQTRPTIVREFAGSRTPIDRAAPRPSQSGSDLPAEGRFWIDPRRGTVVRSEVRFRFAAGATATVTTTYRAEPSLAMWVPAEMKERYEGGGFGQGTDAVARYSRFRKFQVTVEEGDVRLPPP